MPQLNDNEVLQEKVLYNISELDYTTVLSVMWCRALPELGWIIYKESYRVGPGLPPVPQIEEGGPGAVGTPGLERIIYFEDAVAARVFFDGLEKALSFGIAK